MLCFKMAGVNQIDTQLKGELCLMMPDIGGHLYIRTGVVRTVNAVTAGTAAHSHGFYDILRRTHIAQAPAAERIPHHIRKIRHLHRHAQRTDPTDI